MKKMLKYLGLGILMLIMASNTLPVKYLAPICYRLDLSMSIVLFLAYFMERFDKRVWIAFAVKEIFSLLFGNPGVSFGIRLLITMTNGVLDYLMLKLFWHIAECRGRKLLTESISTVYTYMISAIMLNGVYLARLYAFAYQMDYSVLLELAGKYNNNVQGTWSFLLDSVASFYSVQISLVMVLTFFLVKVFCRNQEEKRKQKDGAEYAERRDR